MKAVILTIYAYSSFVSPWGPGPKLVEKFKTKCKCEVQLKETEDVSLFVRSLPVKKFPWSVDLIIGFDQLGVKSAEKLMKWKDVSDLQPPTYVGSGTYKNFVAFDWSPMSFVIKKSALKNPPKKLNDLLNLEYRNQILLEDPSLSSPGLQFLTWISLNKKEDTKAFLQKLKPQIHSISPSWSTAYGLFKKDQAKLVFSYLSSPIYHWKEEKNDDFISIPFEEPHAIQTEWAGIPGSCVQCDQAREFIKFLLSNDGQKILMDFNYMFPVDKNLIKGSLYEKLPKVKTFTPKDYESVDASELIKTWKDALQ